MKESRHEYDRYSRANGWERTGQNGMRNYYISFENLVETSFMNGKWELWISLLMVMNNISRSLLFMTALTF